VIAMGSLKLFFSVFNVKKPSAGTTLLRRGAKLGLTIWELILPQKMGHISP
jgi:hypothetical protein